MITKKLTGTIALAMVLFTACSKKETVTETVKTTTNQGAPFQGQYKKGDHIPSDLVCMVNDAYMGGKKQLEVPYEGKMYYGCCSMCQERIPKEAEVRTAIDAYSQQRVDKATAYIVLIGNEGEVAYFESQKNYEAFKAEAAL